MTYNEAEKAAIMGWYRSGAAVESISILSKKTVIEVHLIINRYLKNGRHISVITYDEIMNS